MSYPQPQKGKPKTGKTGKAGDPNVPYGPEQKAWGKQVPEKARLASPIENPIGIYPDVPPDDVTGTFFPIDYKKFEIPPQGLTDTQMQSALKDLRNYETIQHDKFLGFQANQDERYSDRLSWLLDMHCNNIGDPYTSGLFTVNSKFCERSVLDYFAALWNVDWPHRDEDPKHPGQYSDRYWGYVLTMGCTEANIYGLYNARDYLMGRMLVEDPEIEAKNAKRLKNGGTAPIKRYMYTDPLPVKDSPNAYSPILFYSEDVHYSVVKAARVLNVPTFYEEAMKHIKEPGWKCPITKDGSWPEEVPSHNFDDERSGTIDVKKLATLIRFFADKGYPPIIVLNIGTTWKGSYDDVPSVEALFHELELEYGWLWDREVEYDPIHQPGKMDHRRGFWIHIDGALGAPYLPFIETAHNRALIPKAGPVFDFRNKCVMSIGCSMHKWIGGPFPSGIYMTRTNYQLKPPDTAGYLGSADTTLGGSRSGFAPVVFWDYFARHSHEDNMYKALRTEQNAQRLVDDLRQLEADLQAKYGREVDLWIARSELSLTVRFRLVNPTLSYKYTIDSERLYVPLNETQKQARSYSHIFIMDSATPEVYEKFIADLREACKTDWHDGFPTHDHGEPNPGPVEPIEGPQNRSDKYLHRVPIGGSGFGSFN